MKARSPLTVIFLTVFLDLLGFGMIIPILPFYAKGFGVSDLSVNLLFTAYSLMQLLFAPFWGRLSDRAGRRPILLISIAGSCLSQLGYAVAPSFMVLLAARALAGVCGANVGAAQAYIADVTDEKSRAAGMGMLGAAFGLGFIFGPAFGGVISHFFGERTPFYFASGLALGNFALAFFILREPARRAQRTDALSWSSLARTFSNARLAQLIS